jgi:hypothetical protein
MRYFIILALATLALSTTQASATDTLNREVVKTGILPSGGFYSIYEVACRDNSQANIVSLAERSRWCAGSEGELVCFKRSQLASKAACGSDNRVAANGESTAEQALYQ